MQDWVQRLKRFTRSRANLFVLKFLSVYILWKGFHYAVARHNSPFFSLWHRFTDVLGSYYAHVTSFLLNLFGEQTTHNGIRITYIGSLKSVFVEDHCLAIPAMVIFTGSVLLFTGKWRDKLWFIPLGLMGILLINIGRLVFVCTAFQHFSAGFYKINHSFVYVVITYGLIFMMIIWWMTKFSNDEKTAIASSHPLSAKT
jgi:exosortase/archaeosortase family protein